MIAAVLLDTHIFLWVRAAPNRLKTDERAILDGAQSRYVSIVSIWEAALLMSLGRIGSNQRLLEIPRGFDLLPVQPAHCRELLRLPQYHRDPFDRMMIAQARYQRLPLLTRDAAILAYVSTGLTVLPGAGA